VPSALGGISSHRDQDERDASHHVDEAQAREQFAFLTLRRHTRPSTTVDPAPGARRTQLNHAVGGRTGWPHRIRAPAHAAVADGASQRLNQWPVSKPGRWASLHGKVHTIRRP
jgi:hypothetical protein